MKITLDRIESFLILSFHLPPGLIALHSNCTEMLAETVFAWLQAHPLGPLEQEVVLVQSNGMAEWFKMALARQEGICAAMQVELPGRFLWRTYRQVLGKSQVPFQSPLDKAALTWRLVRQLPQLLDTPGFEPIAGFCRAAVTPAACCSWPRGWPTCWTSTRSTGPTGWGTGSAAAMCWPRPAGRPLRCRTTNAGNPCCGAGCWRRWTRASAAPSARTSTSRRCRCC